MADHAHSPQEASSHPVNAAMAFCLVLVAAGIVAMVMSAPELPEVTEASFKLTTPQVDTERLVAERASHYADVDLSAAEAEIDQLYEAVKQANEMQFGAPDPKAAHDLQITTLHHANAVITELGIDAFVPAGQELFDKCSTEFEKLAAAVQSGALSADQASTDPGEAHADYRAYCGNAFGPLLQSGVIGPDGRWADPESGPAVFDIMNRFRWATVLDLRKPPWKQLAPYEFEILTRWRASIGTVPIEKRVQWVVNAGQVLPGLPTEELIGSLLYENGDKQGALGAYEEACQKNPRDLALQRRCEWLRGKVGAGG